MKNKNAFVSVHIADLHFGALDPKEMISQLKEIFLKYLISNKKSIDMICIDGDFWDTKIPLTEQASIKGIKFFNDLCLFCNRNDIQFRIIKGTKTHDFNQLDNFKYLEKQYPCLKIINTVTVEEIEGVKILYVPEEYMNDQDAYYKIYKEDNFDLMFGHGTWDVFAFDNQITESERNIKGSPVFKYSEWDKVINSKIIFGHIHVHNKYKKLEYPGSFTRWIFGEEKPKGFLVNTMSLATRKSTTEFIENTMATEYDTVNLSDIIKDDESVESITETIEELTNSDKKIKIKIDTDISSSDLNILKESFSEKNNLKIQMQSVRKQVEEEGETEEHDFLENDLPTNVRNYIKEMNDVELSEEEIEEILADTDEE